MPTLVCVPITVVDVPAALRDADEAASGGADLVEFRIDAFFSGSGDAGEQAAEEAGVLRLVRESPLPCIVTCRPAWEGGDYDGDDSARVSLFERLGAADDPAERPRYLDMELAAYTRSANLRQKVNLAVDHPAQRRDLSTSLILSTHDFEERPADLTRRLLKMADEDACRVMKIAYRARSLRDNLDLFDVLGQARDLGKPAATAGEGASG
ncbi:MAG: type I 3-dehydroquinate dehydratase [Planctomycetota bacterium]